jgi:hypothetical protein
MGLENLKSITASKTLQRAFLSNQLAMVWIWNIELKPDIRSMADCFQCYIIFRLNCLFICRYVCKYLCIISFEHKKITQNCIFMDNFVYTFIHKTSGLDGAKTIIRSMPI